MSRARRNLVTLMVVLMSAAVACDGWVVSTGRDYPGPVGLYVSLDGNDPDHVADIVEAITGPFASAIQRICHDLATRFWPNVYWYDGSGPSDPTRGCVRRARGP